jgi:serine/threonine protein kinase
MRLSILIPAYHEERTIAEVLRQVSTVDTQSVGWEKEIIVCDDGSTDGTSREIEQVAADLGGIKLVVHPANRGKGAAIRTQARVVAVEPEHAAVVLADGTRVAGDRLVLAAGPWTPGLVPALAAGVTPSRQLVAYLEPPADLAAAWQAMPVLADLSPEASFYAVPPASGMRLKIAGHPFSLAGDPELRQRFEREARAVSSVNHPHICALYDVGLQEGAH